MRATVTRALQAIHLPHHICLSRSESSASPRRIALPDTAPDTKLLSYIATPWLTSLISGQQTASARPAGRQNESARVLCLMEYDYSQNLELTQWSTQCQKSKYWPLQCACPVVSLLMRSAQACSGTRIHGTHSVKGRASLAQAITGDDLTIIYSTARVIDLRRGPA
jgi:hypothetical protein